MLIQEDYFKNIFNTVREAILILDENMRVLSANRSFFITFKVDAAKYYRLSFIRSWKRTMEHPGTARAA